MPRCRADVADDNAAVCCYAAATLMSRCQPAPLPLLMLRDADAAALITLRQYATYLATCWLSALLMPLPCHALALLRHAAELRRVVVVMPPCCHAPLITLMLMPLMPLFMSADAAGFIEFFAAAMLYRFRHAASFAFRLLRHFAAIAIFFAFLHFAIDFL